MKTIEEEKRTAGRAFELTPTDQRAVDLGDSEYINNKGASLYREGTYAQAVEYYRLAAAMGSVHAVSNLGYCYLYGRDIEPDTQLAIAYFKTAAAGGDVDAAYKLGDIYSRDKWGLKDPEMSVYYYRMAASFIIDTPWENSLSITYCSRLQEYPSLCYALGRELFSGENMSRDMESAYQFLKQAEAGYRTELANGGSMYEKAYAGVVELLSDPRFNHIRKRLDAVFDEEYGEEEFAE